MEHHIAASTSKFDVHLNILARYQVIVISNLLYKPEVSHSRSVLPHFVPGFSWWTDRHGFLVGLKEPINRCLS